MLSAFHPIATI
jgi:hypothetical protein